MRQVERSELLPSGGMLHLAGAGSGPPLLFLHGVGGGAWSWKPQIEALGSEYRCFVWEARGHGAAPRVRDAGLADYFTDAREALERVRRGNEDRIVVAGHSMGGLLAVALAARDAAQIAGLVLVDPVYPDAGGASAHDLGPLRPYTLALMKPLVASFMNDGLLARVISRWMFVNSFEDKQRMEAAWRDQRRQVPIEYPKLLFEAFGQPEGFAIMPFAEYVDVPVLAFNARSRELKETLRRRLGARFADERIRGGHYLQLDRPAELNGRLVRFLREQIDT